MGRWDGIDEIGHGLVWDLVVLLLILQADKTAAVNPMKELRIEKLVISAFTSPSYPSHRWSFTPTPYRSLLMLPRRHLRRRVW
jgi:hypothetical protein